MGIFITLVTQFSTIPYLQEESDNVTVWFNIAVNGLAIFAVIFGHCCLFEKPDKAQHTEYSNCCTKFFKQAERFLFGWATDGNIGSHNRGMGLVIFVVSLALVLLEFVFVYFLFESQNVDVPFCFFLLSFLLEKAVQTFFYIRIRKRKPLDGYEEGAAFYFNFLAFLNFTWWLSNISFAEIRIHEEVAHISCFRYFDETYKALLIDYRLLCALLFLECSVAISANIKERQQEVISDNAKKTKTVLLEQFEMQKNRYKYTFISLVIAGVICLAAETATNFSELVAVYIWHIVLDVVLVVLGWFLLKSCKDKKKSMLKSIFHNSDDIEKVEFMVLSMGAASIVYLLSFGLMCWTSFKDEEPVKYMKWYGSVLLFRGLSLVFLLFLYTGIPLRTMETVDSHKSCWNYALVSALFVGLLTRFVSSIIDEQLGDIHDIAHHHMTSKKLRYLRDLFALGPLFQLATCLHLSLYFLLMLFRLHEKPKVENVQADVEAGFGNPRQLRESVDRTAAVVPEQGNVENDGQLPANQVFDNPAFESKRKQTAATEKIVIIGK